MVVPVHEHLRLLPGTEHQPLEGLRQHSPFGRAQCQRQVRSQQPVGKQRHLTLQQRPVIGGQTAAVGGLYPQQCTDGVPVQGLHAVPVQFAQVEPVAQILEQKKPLLQVLRVDMRHVHTGPFQAPGDIDKGPAVLPARWCIHDDTGSTTRQTQPEIAPETGVTGSRNQIE